MVLCFPDKVQASSSPSSKVKSEPKASLTESKVSPGSKRPQSDSAKKPGNDAKKSKKNNEDEDKKKKAVKKTNPKNIKKGSRKSKKMIEEVSSDESGKSNEEAFQIKSEAVKKNKKSCKAEAKGKSPARSQPGGSKRNTIKAEDDEEEVDKSDETQSTFKVYPGSKRPSESTKGKQERGGKKQKKNNEADAQSKMNEAEARRSIRSRASRVSYKDDSSEGGDGLSDDEYKPNMEESSEVDSEEESGIESEEKNSDLEFEVQSPKAKGKCWASFRACGTKKDKEDLERKRKQERIKRRAKKGDDEWLEVYLVGAKKWVCVDVARGVERPDLCTSHASQPIIYVVGIDTDSYLKDLSKRYDPLWLTASRKYRINPEWWEETLQFYKSPDSERNQQEDKEVGTFSHTLTHIP